MIRKGGLYVRRAAYKVRPWMGFFCLFFIALFLIPSAVNALTIGKPLNFLQLSTGLVGHWTFDGTDTNWLTGKVTDRSGQDNAAYVNGMSTSTSITPGKLGQSLWFNGSQYVGNSSPSIIKDLTNNFSLSLWAKIDKLPAGVTQGLIQNNTRWQLVINTNGKFRFTTLAVQDYDFVSYTVPKNVWLHVSVVFDSLNDASLYVNGQFVQQVTGTSPASGAAGLFRLGTLNASGMFGGLDDVRIYNRVLTAAEIKAIYTMGGNKVSLAPNNPDLSRGLVGWWTFDGKDITNGRINDVSGQGNHGNTVSIATSTFYTAGKIGQGLKFDGVDDYVRTSDPANESLDFGANQDFSWSAWFKIDRAGSGAFISKRAGSGAGYAFYFNSLSLANFLIFNSSGTPFGLSNTDINLQIGVWKHVAVSVDRDGLMKIYVNGVLVQQPDISSAASDDLSNSNVFQIGEWTGAGRPFKGKLDDVRVYNRALSAAEIKAIYSMGGNKISASPTTGATDGLLGHWTFDGKDIDWLTGRVTDRSGQGNTGYVINMSTTTSITPGKIGQSLKFGGIGDKVVAGDVADVDNATALTVAFWVKFWAFDSIDDLVAKYDSGNADGFRLWVSSAQTCSVSETNLFVVQMFEGLGGTDNNCLISDTNTAKLNTWTHVVVTAVFGSSTGLQMYIDGVLDPNSPRSLSTVSNIDSGILDLSFSGAAGSLGCKCSMDDVRLYNRALSANEVRQLYNLGR